MLDSATLAQLAFINTLGLSTLVQAFRTASYVYLSSNQLGRPISPKGRTRRQAAECLAFIQGTGLELLLQRHMLEYDADTLREEFFRIMGHPEDQ